MSFTLWLVCQLFQGINWTLNLSHRPALLPYLEAFDFCKVEFNKWFRCWCFSKNNFQTGHENVKHNVPIMRFFSKDLIVLRLFENKKKTMNDTHHTAGLKLKSLACNWVTESGYAFVTEGGSFWYGPVAENSVIRRQLCKWLDFLKVQC